MRVVLDTDLLVRRPTAARLGGGQSGVERYVRALDHALAGPARVKRRMLTEARDGLDDAARDLEEAGLPRAEAERRAVDEFGSVAAIAPAYQAELAACASRSLGLRVVAVFATLGICGDLMWRGAPWSGPVPPAGYMMVSTTLNVVTMISLGVALLGMAGLWLTARRGRAAPLAAIRAFVLALVALLGLSWVNTVVIFTWSVEMWNGALTWPPMIVGAAFVVAGSAWVARGAVAGIGAMRPARA